MTDNSNDIITSTEELDAIAGRAENATPDGYRAYHADYCERAKKGTLQTKASDCSCGLSTDIPRLIATITDWADLLCILSMEYPNLQGKGWHCHYCLQASDDTHDFHTEGCPMRKAQAIVVTWKERDDDAAD